MLRVRLPRISPTIAALLAVLLPGCASAHVRRGPRPAPQPTSDVCDRFAAAGAHGHSLGTAARPFHSAQKLINVLRPGQTGCLERGTYDVNLRFDHGGRRYAPLTLRSVPGQRARIVGRLYIPQGSNNVRVTDLTLDGRNREALPSPTVNATNAVFSNDDVTNEHTAICFNLGNPKYGIARGTVIEKSRIHDCGVLPANNHEHGIYLANTIGARVVDNEIYNNADRGIQLYPDAQRTLITGNVIDHNGEGIIISGDERTASSHNLIVGNVITDSVTRADVESAWADSGPVGVGNVVAGNCVFGGAQAIDESGGGFTARDNDMLDPHYLDAGAANFSEPKGSPCAALRREGLNDLAAEIRRAEQS